jgi:cyanate permease
MAFLIGGAIGPALSGYLRDATGGYQVSLVTAAGLLCVAAAIAWRLRTAQPWDQSVPAVTLGLEAAGAARS